MSIALATIRTNIYTTLYNHLQTGTYAITSNNIHPSFNRDQTTKEGYPQIIITKPIVETSRLTFGSANSYSVPFTVRIDLYEDSAAESKALADEVMNKLLSGKATLRTNGIKNLQLDEDDVDSTNFTASNTIHQYSVFVKGLFIGTI